MTVADDTDDELCVIIMSMVYQQHLLSYERTFRSLLNLQARRNRSGTIRRKALLDYDASPFVHLYNSGQDDALITLTGFDYASFHLLLDLFGIALWFVKHLSCILQLGDRGCSVYHTVTTTP